MLRPRLVIVAAAFVATLGATAFALVAQRGHRDTAPPATTAPPRHVAPRPRPAVARRAPAKLVVTRTGALAAPLQDAAAAPSGTGALLLGGLTAADTSSAGIERATARASRPAGQLPGALHDGAAARIGNAVYLFGGGNGVAQLDGILRVGLAGGAPRSVGRLPTPSSDQAAAPLGSAAYVVGGYTGARWLDTIVAFRPGTSARVVAHLPTPLRYAAVAAARGTLVIAGGSLPSGAASATVYAFTPATGKLRRLASLPHPLTHAAAAALGGAVYVVGGRGASQGTQTPDVLRIDPLRSALRRVARLPQPLSDASAATAGSRILVAGGRTAAGTVASILTLALHRASAPRRTAAPRFAVPPLLSKTNVYAADARGRLAPATRHALARIYVPNSLSDTVDVIDPHTLRVVEHFRVGALPQHVTPAYDLRRLYVLNDAGNSVTPIDPRTAKPGRPIPVEDPYNMYFTPDGRYAIVVAERLQRLDFRDAHSFALHRSLPVGCPGVDHMDFSANGAYAIASCEFSGQLLKLDVAREKVLARLTLPDGRDGMPQDVKLSPDGSVFYVADQHANGVWLVDGARFRVTGFRHTGTAPHGLYPSRDARFLYVTNRGAGSVTVISFASSEVVATWRIPGGGSPDMGGVSADGKVLWLSGRYSGVVYALSTRNGKLLARIPVGRGPHGLAVWPQPGRYSLGHTGILR